MEGERERCGVREKRGVRWGERKEGVVKNEKEVVGRRKKHRRGG